MQSEVAREQPFESLACCRSPVCLRSGETKLDRSLDMLGLDKVGVLIGGQRVQHGRHETASVVGVGLHVTHYHLHRHVLGGLAPAVVVRGHTDHLVGDFSLACQFGLGEARHVDDTTAPRAVHVAFGAGRELRSL